MEYCDTHLKKISSGSSRTVYRIDDQKVLKLAHNKKGLAQNEVEISFSNYTDISDIIAFVFDKDENNIWLEMELAEKLTMGRFQVLTGFKWKDYVTAIENYAVVITGKGYNNPIDQSIIDEMWEEDFTYNIFNFMGNYKTPYGDLTRLSTYGIVKREGSDSIIMVDYGLTNEVFNNHYSK